MDDVAYKRSPHITWHPTNYGRGIGDISDCDMAGGSRETRGRGPEGSRVPWRPKSCKGKGDETEGREGEARIKHHTNVVTPSKSSSLGFLNSLPLS